MLYYKANSITILEPRVKTWLETAPPEIQSKLERVGLIKIPKRRTVGEMWETFFNEKEGTVKESTFTTYAHSKRRFFSFFRENEFLHDLTKDRMLQWRSELTKQLAEASTAGTVAKTRAVFNWAVEKGWIEANPMKGVPQGSFRNKKRDFDVTMDMYRRLLDACPCRDWQAIIALVRIGGLRAPSEVLRLRWSDVHWEKNRLYVLSAKTEHHEGKEKREVPIFPELDRVLRLVYETAADKDSGFVINRYRDPEQTNLGTQFARIVKKAGLEPIPRPFDNMRASRSTEIYTEFNPFLERQWLGHSTKMARDHYLQVRDIDFFLAAGGQLHTPTDEAEPKVPKSDADSTSEDQKERGN